MSSARESYFLRLNQAENNLATIQAYLKEISEISTPHWGHVGLLADVADRLEEIVEMVK